MKGDTLGVLDQALSLFMLALAVLHRDYKLGAY